jgi:hypothetical protein
MKEMISIINDSKIVEIMVSDEEKESISMPLFVVKFKTDKLAKEAGLVVVAAKKIAESEGPDLNFKIAVNNENLMLKGNLQYAVNLLNFRGILSEDIMTKISLNPKMKGFISKSQDCIFQKSKTQFFNDPLVQLGQIFDKLTKNDPKEAMTYLATLILKAKTAGLNVSELSPLLIKPDTGSVEEQCKPK